MFHCVQARWMLLIILARIGRTKKIAHLVCRNPMFFPTALKVLDSTRHIIGRTLLADWTIILCPKEKVLSLRNQNISSSVGIEECISRLGTAICMLLSPLKVVSCNVLIANWTAELCLGLLEVVIAFTISNPCRRVGLWSKVQTLINVTICLFF